MPAGDPGQWGSMSQSPQNTCKMTVSLTFTYQRVCWNTTRCKSAFYLDWGESDGSESLFLSKEIWRRIMLEFMCKNLKLCENQLYLLIVTTSSNVFPPYFIVAVLTGWDLFSCRGHPNISLFHVHTHSDISIFVRTFNSLPSLLLTQLY